MIHQANHARIQALKEQSSALDNQIKSTLMQLAETRAELKATPATTFPADTYPVPYTELLSFARRISKFTLPPTYREAATPPSVAEPSSAGVNTNGTTTPTTALNAASAGITQNDVTTVPADDKTALPKNIHDWLNPLGGAGFVPWPSEESIRRGSLALIQTLKDRGEDPATFDPDRDAVLEEERKKQEAEQEKVRLKEEEKEKERRARRMEEERVRRESAAASGEAAPAAAAKPKEFTFGLDDDDDDE
jgi:hypothetical protein